MTREQWERRFSAALTRRMKHRGVVIFSTDGDYGNLLGVAIKRGRWRNGVRMSLRVARRRPPERVVTQVDRAMISWIKRPKHGRGAGWKKRGMHAP